MTTCWPLADHLVTTWWPLAKSFGPNVYDCFTMQSVLWPNAPINGGVGSAFHRMKINIYIYRVGANIWIPGTLIRNWFSKSESLIHDLDKVEALKGKGANATYRHHCTFTLEVHGTTQYIKCHFGACSNTKNRVCSNTKKVCSNTQNRSLKEMQHCTTCT